jgi:alpha-tubulin suppressor-like RCC1 family protein
VLVAKPVAVPHVTDAIDIVAGNDHTCVRRKSGAITCWGGNTFGELGPGGEDVRIVTRSVGATTQLAVGDNHTCALRADGSVACWGDSETTRGETKPRPEDQRDPTPRLVAGLPPAAEICALPVDSCARLRAGGIACWGSRYGVKPVRLDGSDGATSLSCGAEAPEVCWVDASHAATCASETERVALPALHDVARIAFGSDHACALHVDGSVECWGKNEFGQLGTGTVDHPTGPVPLRPVAGSPQPVHPLRGVKQLAIGSMRTAAILDDDALAVWGYGPIGDGRDCSGPPCDGVVPTEVSFTR